MPCFYPKDAVDGWKKNQLSIASRQMMKYYLLKHAK